MQASGTGLAAKQGKWLPNDHHLEQDCESNVLIIFFASIHLTIIIQDTLEFRKKHEMMKVQLNDGSVKTVLLDMSAKVGGILIQSGYML